MAALWIFAVLAVLLLLLCLIRVGVLVRFGNELIVTVRLGVFVSRYFRRKNGQKKSKSRSESRRRAQKGRNKRFQSRRFPMCARRRVSCGPA